MPHKRAFPAPLLLLVVLACASSEVNAHPGPHARIAELTLALARHPGDAELWLARAEEYLADGRPAAALRDVARAETLAPGEAGVPLVRGAVLLALGRAAEAEVQLTLAIGRDPESVSAHRLRARARRSLDRPREAAADYERCVALSPAPSPDDFLEWSRALAAAEPGRLGAAIAALERGLAELGASAALVEEAVALDCARGAHDQALARIERHPAACGSAAARRARRGEVLLAAGRELEAQAEFSAALSDLEAARRRRPATVRALEARLHAALGAASSAGASP